MEDWQVKYLICDNVFLWYEKKCIEMRDKNNEISAKEVDKMNQAKYVHLSPTWNQLKMN